MASPDRLQIDDHFARAKARAHAPKPAAAYGTGSVLLVLVVVAGAAAGAWWWAVQPPSAAAPTAGLPMTVAERQAAVAADVDAAERGPRLGGETPAEYQARLAALRAQGAGAPPADVAPPDRAAAGRLAPASGGSAATTATTTRSATAAPAAAALAAPDSSALGLAGRVNERRQERATHLRWLDACERQHLVDLARAYLARARDNEARNSASIAANNLAADIDTHQREARRVDGLLTTAEQRLADYCAANHQQVPTLDNPPVTVTGVAAQPRAMPAAVNRQAATASRSTGGFNPFADQP